MVKKLSIATQAHTELVDITAEMEGLVRESKLSNGILHIFVPHTTAAVTINENADASVKRDILKGLDRMAPLDERYEHSEGNAAAHIKSTIVGTDKTVFFEDGSLVLGTWQGIFFCEFDGPRKRDILVNITGR